MHNLSNQICLVFLCKFISEIVRLSILSLCVYHESVNMSLKCQELMKLMDKTRGALKLNYKHIKYIGHSNIYPASKILHRHSFLTEHIETVLCFSTF